MSNIYILQIIIISIIIISFCNKNAYAEFKLEGLVGPFICQNMTVENCPGVRVDSSIIQHHTYFVRDNVTGEGNFYTNVTVFKSGGPISVNIRSFIKKKGLYRRFTKFQINDICQMRYLTGEFQNVTVLDSKCYLKKGTDNIKHSNYCDLIDQYTGGNAFYGDIKIRSLMFWKKKNLVCSVLNVIVSPKPPLPLPDPK